MKAKRQKHSSIFKAKVAIDALQERESLSELAKKYELQCLLNDYGGQLNMTMFT